MNWYYLFYFTFIKKANYYNGYEITYILSISRRPGGVADGVSDKTHHVKFNVLTLYIFAVFLMWKGYCWIIVVVNYLRKYKALIEKVRQFAQRRLIIASIILLVQGSKQNIFNVINY